MKADLGKNDLHHIAGQMETNDIALIWKPAYILEDIWYTSNVLQGRGNRIGTQLNIKLVTIKGIEL